MNEEIQKGIILVIILVICFSCAMTWHTLDRCIKLETQIKSLKIETSFMIGSLERDLEVLEANLIRLKKEQW